MSDPDYAALGFKAGLEIHQQLEGRKLFCACPAVVREDEPHLTVSRQLRASVGESGELDVAASHEQRKSKLFVYHGYHDTTCLVELDEEPVSDPGAESVRTAVMTARLLGMTLVDEVHPMRKVVVDGSNTSAFQRTMLCAVDGTVKDVRVERLCLEEDAAKIVLREEEQDTYNLSRLGIPLLEITTAPDIRDPQHLQEIAAELGMVLRSTRRVKRGLGTIRQDVNISIAEGARVEIKGVQDLELMPLIAKNEVLRQQALVGLTKEDIAFDAEAITAQTITTAFMSSKPWVQKLLASGAAVGARLPQHAGLLGRELFSGYRLGSELAGMAKAWGFGGIIHDSEDPSTYGAESWDAVRGALRVEDGDGFMILVGDARKAEALLSHYLPERLAALLAGVPSEVRKASDDGTTAYMRPMPGAARMYPETDCRPFRIGDVEVVLPELLTDRVARIAASYSLPEQLSVQLVRAGRDEEFERWATRIPPVLLAEILATKEKELRRRHQLSLDLSGVSEELFTRLADGKVSRDAIDDVLVSYARDGAVDWDRYVPVAEDDVRSAVREVIAEDEKAPYGALMGGAMKRLGGKADGKLVARILREELGR